VLKIEKRKSDFEEGFKEISAGAIGKEWEGNG
jgi:hypothetical protein